MSFKFSCLFMLFYFVSNCLITEKNNKAGNTICEILHITVIISAVQFRRNLFLNTHTNENMNFSALSRTSLFEYIMNVNE